MFRKLLLLAVLAIAFSTSSSAHRYSRREGGQGPQVVRHVYNGGRHEHGGNDWHNRRNKFLPGSQKEYLMNLENALSDTNIDIEIHCSDGNPKIITNDGLFYSQGKLLGYDGIWINKKKFTVYVAKWSGWWVGKLVFNNNDEVKGMKTMFVRTKKQTENPPVEVFTHHPNHFESGKLYFKTLSTRVPGVSGVSGISEVCEDGVCNVEINESGQIDGKQGGNDKNEKNGKNSNKNGKKNKKHKLKHKKNKKNKNKNKEINENNDENNNNKRGCDCGCPHCSKHHRGGWGYHGHGGGCCGGFKKFIGRLFVLVMVVMFVCCFLNTYWTEFDLCQLCGLSWLRLNVDLVNKEIKLNWDENNDDNEDNEEEMDGESIENEKEQQTEQSNDEIKVTGTIGEIIENESDNMEIEDEDNNNNNNNEVNDWSDDESVISSTVATKGAINTDDGVASGEQ